MIRVFVADNHPIIHKGVKAVFRNSSEIDIVGKGIHYRELIDFLNAKKVSVILLELSLPGFDGIHLLKEIKKEHPKVRILIFSSLEEELYAISTLKAGASGYLCKTAPLNHLREAILKISAGGVFITNQLAEVIAFSETGGNPNAALDKLSEREIQVLRHLVNGKRNKEIGLLLGINDKTVSTYRTRIMKKLEVKNFVELVHKTEHVNLDFY